jgi:hypothetical protein
MNNGHPIIHFTEDDRRNAYEVAQRRQRDNDGSSHLPGGETDSPEKLLENNHVACLGEISVAIFYGLKWTGKIDGRGGRIRDVGDFLEVRAITESWKRLLVRPDECAAIYFCCLLRKGEGDKWRTSEILGWASKHVVINCGFPIDQNTDHPAWLLDQKYLTPAEDLFPPRVEFTLKPR